jgi:hypothetical protein
MTLIPTQVTFRGLPHSDELESEIRQRVVWLEQFYAGVVQRYGDRGRVTLPLLFGAQNSENREFSLPRR